MDTTQDEGPESSSSQLINAILKLTLVLWISVNFIEVIIQGLISHSVFYIEAAQTSHRFSALLFSWTANLIYLFFFSTFLLLLRKRCDEIRQEKRTLSLLYEIVLWLTVGLSIFLYIASWNTFRDVITFLNGITLEFWSLNPLQVIQHAAHTSPLSILPAPLLTLPLTWLIARTLPRWALKSKTTKLRFAWIAFVLILISTIIFELISLSSNERIAYEKIRNGHTAPLAHLFGSQLTLAMLGEEPFGVDSAIPIERSRQISNEDYAKLAKEVKKPLPYNVIVLVVESLREDQLKAFGGTRSAMPVVEDLAKNSLLFTDCLTQSSHSSYADISILSSQYPLREEFTHFYPKNPAYPRFLIYDALKHGYSYRTAIVSSQNEAWGAMDNYLRTDGIDHFFHSETFDGETYRPEEDLGFAEFADTQKRSGKIDDRYTVQESIRWFKEQDSKPFFMYINLQNSHLPYVFPPDFERPFGANDPDVSITFGSVSRSLLGAAFNRYSDSLAYVDSQIEKLFTALKKEKQWSKTLIVVTGDTGQAFYEHGFIAHGNKLYNEVMKVPLIIRVPGLGRKEISTPAQHIDIPPTVFALLGMKAHPSWQGKNLTRPLERKPSRYLVSHTARSHQYAVVKEGHKLIFDKVWHQVELYDLASDPAEKNDLSLKKPELTKRLAKRLNTWRKAQLDYYTNPKRQAEEYPPKLGD